MPPVLDWIKPRFIHIKSYKQEVRVAKLVLPTCSRVLLSCSEESEEFYCIAILSGHLAFN